jgi:anti-anti-sigma regulatory factor
MSSMPSQPDISGDERSLRLPANGTTIIAEDLRLRLVLSSDRDEEIVVDASEVEYIGQAVLQLLVAARAEAERSGKPFIIFNPSFAFSDRAIACRLAALLGLETPESAVQ